MKNYDELTHDIDIVMHRSSHRAPNIRFQSMLFKSLGSVHSINIQLSSSSLYYFPHIYITRIHVSNRINSAIGLVSESVLHTVEMIADILTAATLSGY